MERRAAAALAAILAIPIAVLAALAFVRPPVPSRTLTLEELRAGVDLELAGVRIQESFFHDLSQVDGGTTVAFLVSFADGTSENVSFVYQTFLCRDVTATTAHLDPQVVFSARCGESSVLVQVV